MNSIPVLRFRLYPFLPSGNHIISRCIWAGMSFLNHLLPISVGDPGLDEIAQVREWRVGVENLNLFLLLEKRDI